MTHMSGRERTEAVGFYVLTALATLGWWVLLFAWPESRPLFFGKQFSEGWWWLFLAPDAVTAIVGAVWVAVAVQRPSVLAPALAWVHFGCQGYAWLMCLGLAVRDASGSLGLALMTFSAGTALAFAIRLSGLGVLWGPFAFKPAKAGTARSYWRQAVGQTALMWASFLVAIPIAIAAAEHVLGWDKNWIDALWRLPVAGAAFVFGGSLGLYASKTMTSLGEGTPLPSSCAKKLVQSGPYRFIRNPMAFGGILQGACVGLAIGSPLIIVYAVIGGVWWEVLVRPVEEQRLKDDFGDEYEAYRSRVPCWRFRF